MEKAEKRLDAAESALKELEEGVGSTFEESGRKVGGRWHRRAQERWPSGSRSE
jgi:hypothetical protein